MAERTGDPGLVAARLAAARRVLVTTHASPDGDAIGSELALAELLDRMGKAVVVANRDSAPANLAFLPSFERIRPAVELPRDLAGDFDLGVVLDCPGLDRPHIDSLPQLPLVEIDHHLENALFGEINYVDEAACATGELVLYVIEAAGVPLTPTMATALHVALATDTGDFRYANASARAFRAAARLVDAGARPAAIAESLWEHVPERVVRLTAAVLATLERHLDGRLAVVTCDRATLTATGARPEDAEDLVNYPRAIEGVEVAAFLKAFVDGSVRVSLRSRGRVDVQAVARTFGGGGHREAAGCTLVMTLPTARETVIAAVAAVLERS